MNMKKIIKKNKETNLSSDSMEKLFSTTTNSASDMLYTINKEKYSINDVFVISVEKILIQNPNNYRLLQNQLDFIYNCMYGINGKIN